MPQIANAKPKETLTAVSLNLFPIPEGLKGDIEALPLDAFRPHLFASTVYWYGVDALAHGVVLARAAQVVDGSLSPKDFFQTTGICRYDGHLGGSYIGHVVGPRTVVAQAGIFVPLCDGAYRDNARRQLVFYFDNDYVCLPPIISNGFANTGDFEPTKLCTRDFLQAAGPFVCRLWDLRVRERFDKNRQSEPVAAPIVGLVEYYATVFDQLKAKFQKPG